MINEYTPREIRLIAERDAAVTRAENAEARLANAFAIASLQVAIQIHIEERDKYAAMAGLDH